MCIHLIDPMGIHFLCYAHGNEHIRTHDAIHDPFVTIVRDASFHVITSASFNHIQLLSSTN
jgi:hypothetical protein